MARNPEVQLSIDKLSVTHGDVIFEAEDVVISATGSNAYEAAEAVRAQLAQIMGQCQPAEADDEEPDTTSSWPPPRSITDTNP